MSKVTRSIVPIVNDRYAANGEEWAQGTSANAKASVVKTTCKVQHPDGGLKHQELKQRSRQWWFECQIEPLCVSFLAKYNYYSLRELLTKIGSIGRFEINLLQTLTRKQWMNWGRHLLFGLSSGVLGCEGMINSGRLVWCAVAMG